MVLIFSHENYCCNTKQIMTQFSQDNLWVSVPLFCTRPDYTQCLWIVNGYLDVSLTVLTLCGNWNITCNCYDQTGNQKKTKKPIVLRKQGDGFLLFLRNRSWSNTRWFCGKKRKIYKENLYITENRLKAYSLISYRGRSQKFQNLNFLHLFVAFLQEGHFTKGI